ncbi:MAG TPA: glycosyltransferase [Vicinamibacteria bacterium]|nr:glycosyltransferase [Vicinamibacteria bacterium]
MTAERRGRHAVAAPPPPSAAIVDPEMEARPEVLLFVLDAGGGHRAAARALQAAAALSPRRWDIRVTNLQDVLAPADFTRRITGRPMEDAYNAIVRRRWTRFLVPMLRVLQWGIRRMSRPLARLVADHLAEVRPAAVVSLIPNFNGVLAEARRLACPDTPFVIVLTDLADFPPHFWIAPGADRVVVATEHAAAQARAAGLPPAAISITSGMILHPRFHVPDPAARQRTRRELGIGMEDFTVLVLFGGKGSPEVHPLAAALLDQSPRWHVMAICGDNPRLEAAVGELGAASGGRLHCFGFTDRVMDLLAACDVVATKPGPGTLAEAFHCRVPVVVPCTPYTIPQERYNAVFVRENELGVVVRHWREIPNAISSLAADPVRRTRMRRRLESLPGNRAVFEVLDVLEAEVEGAGALRPPSHATVGARPR